MIPVKTPEELDVQRENGRLLAAVVAKVVAAIRPGENTAVLDALAESLIRDGGAEPSFKGYQGYPAAVCTSLNEEVVHGIPSASRRLRDGDLLSIDVGLLRGGLHVDMAVTVPVGEVSESARHLMESTEKSLWCAIRVATIGNRVSDISHAIGSFVEGEGLFVVKEYVGHGIGRALHEDPQIPNNGPPGCGPRLAAGMVLAIEPMVKVDDEPTRVLDDQWTVVTGTGGLAAHFEHTIALTEEGVDVLTQGGA
ncbi:MAG: type I methionyl aminopeptidase [Candidatus Bipolaricaulota bacterium]|nr:MAG: type I methionyl aminopeptidase [Candidatus Bipolaricaulota bacterium]